MEVVVKLPKLFDKQIEVVKSKARFKVVMAARRGGKSFMCAQIAILKMLKGERLFYLTPEFSLAKEFYNHLSKYLPQEIIKSSNKSDLTIELITGGYIRFFSGNAADNLRGLKFNYGILDECSYTDNLLETFNTVIRPTLSDYKGGAILISTPKGLNDFNTLYEKGMRGEDDFQSFHFITTDNPHIDPSEVEAARRVLTEAQFNQEYLAIPSANANNPFGVDNIMKCVRQELSKATPVMIAIDFAKIHDWTVITGLDSGNNLCLFERFRDTWENVISKIKEIRNKYPYVPIVVDSTGIGSVLLERLQNEVYNVIGFAFTSASKPVIIHELIKQVEMGSITFNELTMREMTTFSAKYDGSGNVKYSADNGAHDDIIMSLAMCNHFRKQNSVEYNLHIF